MCVGVGWRRGDIVKEGRGEERKRMATVGKEDEEKCGR